MVDTVHSPIPAAYEGLCDAPDLVVRLGSREPVERQAARKELVSIGSPAVPHLIKCLSDLRRQVRWEAAKALGEIADPITATVLVAALEDKDSDVRWLAAEALVAIGREGLRPLLANLIQHSDSDSLREGAHHVCHELAKTADGPIIRPVLDALNTSEPEMAVPGTAFSALRAL
jgi:HEAT repeat protein